MEILKIIGKRIAQARIENKLSQEKLAELSGLHKNYIGSIERAEKNPTMTGDAWSELVIFIVKLVVHF